MDIRYKLVIKTNVVNVIRLNACMNLMKGNYAEKM